jgi:hypothetical protein
MPYLSPYHLSEQQAGALLGPIAAALRDLERRAGHFATRLPLAPADREQILAAQRVLASAVEELARIQAAAEALTEPATAPGGARG